MFGPDWLYNSGCLQVTLRCFRVFKPLQTEYMTNVKIYFDSVMGHGIGSSDHTLLSDDAVLLVSEGPALTIF